MTGENGREGPAYVPGFIYLDMDLVKSISARMGGGYIKELVEGDEVLEEMTGGIKTRLMASIFGIGKQVQSRSSESSSRPTYGIKDNDTRRKPPFTSTKSGRWTT